MNNFATINRVSELAIEIRGAVSALNAIHVAMSQGCDAPEYFYDGLWFIQRALHERTAQLETLADEAANGGDAA